MEIYRVRGRESKTGTTSPSVAKANPQSAPFSSSSVTRHLFCCLGFGFKGRLRCGEKGTQGEHGGNGDALRRGAADSSAPMTVRECALVGHPERDSRVQRKVVCFPHRSFLSRRQADYLVWGSAGILPMRLFSPYVCGF